MKAGQVSFSAGEISPLLHARVDLSKYHTGLAELKNMIVLPQGGITRRAGLQIIGGVMEANGTKLIPFEYSTTDSVMLEFENYLIRVLHRTSAGFEEITTLRNTPYPASVVNDLRYVQSGNVMFITHRNYKPHMLIRNNLTSWSLKALDYEGGPWIDGAEWNANAVLSIDTSINRVNSTASIFNSGLAGTLLKVEYAVNGRSGTLVSGTQSKPNETEPFEVKGTMNVITSGEWRGMITIWRKVPGGSWLEMRQYRRTDTEKQGQWDITISETEEYVLYKVSAWHETLRKAEEKEPIFRAAIENDYKAKRTTELPVRTTLSPSTITGGGVNASVVVNGGSTEDAEISAATYEGSVVGFVSNTIAFSPDEIDDEYEYEEGDIGTLYTKLDVKQMSAEDDTPATVIISSSGFMKKEIYKITSIISGTSARVELQTRDGIKNEKAYLSNIKLWSMGAWGTSQGYPSACAMYQDRLILAGSNLQPQTIWMSRTGDYKDFSTSDPLRDDDAVNITLAGSGADRIHSMTSTGDLLVFTNGGEWKIKGAGDNGAITPTALTAHQQTNIGTKNIQPLTAGRHVILVQSQGKKVYALGYDLNVDGYTGSELSVLSSHIFEDKEIVDMAYQKEPDSLLWFVLSDGTCAVCTYVPEHEVIGWSRQEFYRKISRIACVNGNGRTDLVLWCQSYNQLYYLKDRTNTAGYTDLGNSYESVMRTLRLNASSEDGSAFTSEKLAARLVVSVLRTTSAWAAPGDYMDESRNWERRRKFEMDYQDYLQDVDIQLDNGFSTDAAIQIRSKDNEPLTIAGITPILTVGG